MLLVMHSAGSCSSTCVEGQGLYQYILESVGHVAVHMLPKMWGDVVGNFDFRHVFCHVAAKS